MTVVLAAYLCMLAFLAVTSVLFTARATLMALTLAFALAVDLAAACLALTFSIGYRVVVYRNSERNKHLIFLVCIVLSLGRYYYRQHHDHHHLFHCLQIFNVLNLLFDDAKVG